MASNTETLGIKVEFIDSVTRGLKKTATLSKTVASAGLRIGKAFLKAGKQIAKAFAGAGRLIGGVVVVMNQLFGLVGKLFRGFVTAGRAVWDFVKAGAELERVNARLANTIGSVGHISGITTDALEGWSIELSKATGASRLMIKEGQAILATFTMVGPKVFADATEVLVDMSEQGFGGMKENAIRLGKALNDPILGVTALREVGTSFTPAAVAFVKSLVQQNKVLEAQQFILKQVKLEMGGAARAMKDTMLGRVNQLSTAWEGLSATIGGFVAKNAFLNDAIKKITDTLSDWSIAIMSNEEVQKLLSDVIRKLAQQVLPGLIDAFAKLLGFLPTIVGFFQDVISNVWSAIEALLAFVRSIRKTVSIMAETWKAGTLAGDNIFTKLGDVMGDFIFGLEVGMNKADVVFGNTRDTMKESFDTGFLMTFLNMLSGMEGPLGKLATLLRSGIGTAGDFGKKLGDAKPAEELKPPTGWDEFWVGMGRGLDAAQTGIQDLDGQMRLFAAVGKRVMEDWFSGTRDAFADFLTTVADGTATLREGFKELGEALRTALANALIQGMADVIASKFFGLISSLGSVFGGGGGGKKGIDPGQAETNLKLTEANIIARQIAINTGKAAVGGGVSLGGGEEGGDGAPAPGAFAQIGTFLQGLMGGLMGILGTLGSSLVTIFTSVGGVVLQLFVGVAQLLFQALSALASGVMGMFFQHGGKVTGPGGDDNVPAMLTAGEFVIRKPAVDQLGTDFLTRLNSGGARAFASGGYVSRNYYATGGAVVGGNNAKGRGESPTINFNIQAHDASGFDRLLSERRGEIVAMVRQGMLTQPGFRSQVASIAQTSR